MSINTDDGEKAPTCPSLFAPSAASDGKLARLRVPGGILSSAQCSILAEIVAYLHGTSIDITNRANLQIRGLQEAMPPEVLLKLQQSGLAAQNSQLDRFRNIMASPTAGIDPQQLIDTRPLVRELDRFISSNLDLVGLSPKFSIGVAGGEEVSIEEQPNDILLKAVPGEMGVKFQVFIAGKDLEMAVKPEDCVALVGAIARLYLDAVPHNKNRKPRLQRTMEEIGWNKVKQSLKVYLSSSHLGSGSKEAAFLHLGIRPQLQPDLHCLGIALPLGRWELDALRQIAAISQHYGSGTVRLTPWRSLLLPDLRDVAGVRRELARLGFSEQNNNVWGGMVACSGNTGCASSFTDTQADAIAVAKYLADNLTLNEPAIVHFSGCPKSCAHHGSSHITLVGTPSSPSNRQASYHLYGGDTEQPFGKQLLTDLPPSQLPEKIAQILSLYQKESAKRHLSWQEFIDRGFEVKEN